MLVENIIDLNHISTYLKHHWWLNQNAPKNKHQQNKKCTMQFFKTKQQMDITSNETSIQWYKFKGIHPSNMTLLYPQGY
jgi:hypothetical protein